MSDIEPEYKELAIARSQPSYQELTKAIEMCGEVGKTQIRVGGYVTDEWFSDKVRALEYVPVVVVKLMQPGGQIIAGEVVGWKAVVPEAEPAKKKPAA